MAFFKNFPLLPYSFGDNETPVIFDNLSVYIDIIDSLKDKSVYYEKHTILDGDRPDILSQKLYGKTDYHWTFYLLNNNLRESGWPMTERRIYEKAKIYYPHQTITTQDDISNTFIVGKEVRGTISGAKGIIMRKNLDLGQIVVDTKDPFLPDEIIETGPSIDLTDRAILIRTTLQYLSVHHYENFEGEWLDINPYNQILNESMPITYLDRLIQINTDLKNIIILKPSAVNQIVKQYNLLLKS